MIGQGIYSLADVARLTGLPSATVRSWFKWRSDGAGKGPMFQSDYAVVENETAVSFLDLIDSYVAKYFRDREVPPAIIRKAYLALQAKLNTRHPFAHASLCVGDGRIIMETSGELVDAINDVKWFPQMKDCLDKIEYEGPLAARWHIAKGIIVDPAFSFGQPVIEDTSITTFVLANQFEANQKDAALVSWLFQVKAADVMNAVVFEQSMIAHRRAA